MRKRKKINLIFILLFSLNLAQSPDEKNLKLELQWAGISYINPNVEISSKYPNFTKIEPHLRKLVTNKLKELESSSFNLNINPSGSFKDGSLAMLLAVDSELNSKLNKKVLQQSKCLNSYYLSMQLIIFDPSSSSILQIIPFNLRRPYLDDNACRSNSKQDLFRLSQLILNLDIYDKNEQQAYLKMSDDKMIESLIQSSEQNNSFLNPGSFFGPIMSSIKQFLTALCVPGIITKSCPFGPLTFPLSHLTMILYSSLNGVLSICGMLSCAFTDKGFASLALASTRRIGPPT